MSNLDAKPQIPAPEEVAAPKIVQIAGDKHVLALTDTGEVWVFGNVSGRWNKLPPLPAENAEREAA